MLNEQRTEGRIKLKKSAWIRQGIEPYRLVTLVDISDGGMAVACNLPSVSLVDLVLKTRPGCYLNLKASVAWQGEGKAGLCLSENSRPKVTNYLTTEVTAQVQRFFARRVRARRLGLTA